MKDSKPGLGGSQHNPDQRPIRQPTIGSAPFEPRPERLEGRLAAGKVGAGVFSGDKKPLDINFPQASAGKTPGDGDNLQPSDSGKDAQSVQPVHPREEPREPLAGVEKPANH